MPELREETSDASKRVRYVIRQRSYPAGFQLTVEDAVRQPMFLVRPRPADSSRYVVSPAKEGRKIVFVIKMARIGLATRYTVFDGASERFSILQEFSVGEFLLRDGKRKTIARFKPLGPGTVVLCTPSTVLARLRLIENAGPEGLRIDCDTKAGPDWLLAILLYAVAVTEVMTQPESAQERARVIQA